MTIKSVDDLRTWKWCGLCGVGGWFWRFSCNCGNCKVMRLSMRVR